MPLNQSARSNTGLIISYLTLRRLIGLLGTFLPLVLFLGALIIFQTGLQSSLSSYYHTGMGDVFVGTLVVIGLFLFSYRGHDRKDDIAGDLCCVFAVGVALLPTPPDNPGAGYPIVGYLQFAFAALLFLTLIFMAFFLFTKSVPNQPIGRKKRRRNRVYRACGIAMALTILLIIILNVLPADLKSSIDAIKPLFWLETVMIVAFGISWLVKGEALGAFMKD